MKLCTVFELETRNYTSIGVLTAIDGLYVYLVPNISDYRLPRLMDFFEVLTANDGFLRF